MDRAQRLQAIVIRLHNVANELDELDIRGLSDHVDSIVDEIQAEIQIEIQKGPKVTFK